MTQPTAFQTAARSGRFTDVFVRKPVLAIVINIAILAIGWRAISSLPVRQYPRLESSSIVITTVYIGASAETVRGFITTPIERAVSAIDGIDYIESTSTAGVSMVTVRLRLNHPSVNALAEISARLNQVRSELPPEAESPSVNIQRTDKPYATFYISFTSEQISLTQINEFLVREIQPVFQSIPGVQRVGVEGERPLAMRVWLDAARMDALDVTPIEVQAALARNNFVATVGRTKGPDVQIDLLTNTDLRGSEEFRDLIVRERGGTIVRLRDIARVELGSEEPVAQTGFRGTPSIYLSVWPLPSANELDVSAALRKRMEEVRPSLPSSIDMQLAYDGTYYMENAIKEIAKTLAETIGIVAIVVFLFLGSVRTVLVPLVAIPISLTGACIFMLMMGFSLNLLTILAIVLAVGLVVDDAIVMVENVSRHVRNGMKPAEAALVAGRELAAPITAMTITLAVVYAPIGFQSGLTGMLFREFAFTLAAAVVVSGIVALTLSPIMSSALVGSGREGRFTAFVNRGFDRLRALYGRMLDWTLELRWTMAVAALLIAVTALPLYMLSGSELAPTEDEGFIISVVQSAPDATLAYTLRGFDDVNAVFAEVPERDTNFSVSQTTAGFGGVKMRDWKTRDRTTTQILPEVFMGFSGITAVRVFPVLPPPLPGAGQFGVELMVTSNDDAGRMAQFIEPLKDAAMASGKFMFLECDLEIDLPQVRIEIDRQKVADMGLDLAAIGREMGILLAGGYVNRFNHDGRSYKVIPQVSDAERATPEQLLQLKVRTASGGLVPLSSFVTLRTEAAPRSLTRFQQRNSMKFYGGVIPMFTKADALATLEEEARRILPPGYTLDYAGESRQLRQEGSSLAMTLGFALLLIYLVLAAQFGSFRDPLIVLLGSVPLAITGALVFAFLDWTTVNIYSQVGLITLVGLVAKNGILIVEFANHLQEGGLDRTAAVREASMTRLRPILMTSAATVFGHFPLVIVTGAGAAARNSIGIMLVSGMAISTIFTLFVVPSIYSLIAARREATTKRGEPAAPSPSVPHEKPAIAGPVLVGV